MEAHSDSLSQMAMDGRMFSAHLVMCPSSNDERVPHTTIFMQPNDAGVNRALKAAYKSLVSHTPSLTYNFDETAYSTSKKRPPGAALNLEPSKRAKKATER
jgi:hypothetical protein